MTREGTASLGLPDDVDTLQKLLIQQKDIISGKDSVIAELEKRNGLLIEQVTLLQKYRFARSSETWTEEDTRQLRIFDEAEAEVYRGSEHSESETEEITYRRKKSKGRKALPEELPRTVIVHEIPEDQRRCGKSECVRHQGCGKLRPVIGQESREELEFIPAQIRVKRHVYRKYGQISCQQIEPDDGLAAVITAKREKRIVCGGIVTASLLSHIVVSKFADALPFYR